MTEIAVIVSSVIQHSNALDLLFSDLRPQGQIRQKMVRQVVTYSQFGYELGQRDDTAL